MGMRFSNLEKIFRWSARVFISLKDSRNILMLYGTGTSVAALFSERIAAVLI